MNPLEMETKYSAKIRELLEGKLDDETFKTWLMEQPMLDQAEIFREIKNTIDSEINLAFIFNSRPKDSIFISGFKKSLWFSIENSNELKISVLLSVLFSTEIKLKVDSNFSLKAILSCKSCALLNPIYPIQ